MGWIACDFDATLFEWGEGTSNPGDVLRVGKPIPKMIERIKKHLADGEEVRIFTARVGPATAEECLQAFQGRGKFPPYEGEIGPDPVLDWMNYQTTLIENACREHLGQPLPITAVKDFYMYKLYDDRATQVIPNTGETLEDRHAAALLALAKATAPLDEAAQGPTIGEVLDGQSER